MTRRDGSDSRMYPGPSEAGLVSYPPKERWDDWVEWESRAWPERVERHYMLVPTTCFNCESACGLIAYIDKDTGAVKKFEGNPEHPGSRGRNCAKGPATHNQINDPDRILHPLKRVGPRGGGKWEPVEWDDVLDEVADRIRRAIKEDRRDEVMYHVGRPGEDGFTERILAAWGIDGHNSHTNVCSSSSRAGYHLWMGHDRPSPDHANAAVILLVSAHLETGHYFNPHAQRIMEAKQRGAKLIVLDTRLSNTATHADHWLSTQPGSEAAIFLAIARHLIEQQAYNRPFVETWWNWRAYLAATRPDVEPAFENFHVALLDAYAEYTFEFAAAESGIDRDVLRELADLVAGAGTRLSTHTWRSASAGNEGGWQVSRTLFLLNALMGAVATEGGTYPNGWNKFVPKPIHTPPHPEHWNEITWPAEYPLALNELSFLLPHFLKEGRGKIDTYFTRVYNPVWTNPDGFSWIEMLTDESKIGLHVALTPTWNETAYFADYVLPMGHGPERHDLHSYETHDAQWIGFRQPVQRAARERNGQPVHDTREVNPGSVWEENEFWIDLTWRIDPDGALGIRQYVESKANPGEKLSIDEYYGYIFEHSVPGLPERAAADGRTPLEYMRRTGAFEIARGVGAVYEQEVPAAELLDVSEDPSGRVYTHAPKAPTTNIAPSGSPDHDADGRRPAGVRIGDLVLRGFPTPSGRLEFYSPTLAAWGWKDAAIPTYIRSHVHPSMLAPDEKVLISTFRLPVHVHTRSANAKWLAEIAHTNPLWLHPKDAAPLGVETGDLVRVETKIGYYVVKAWVTEGIRPGVVACSHHMGRWRVNENGQRQMMNTVGLERDGTGWRIRRTAQVSAFDSTDPDTGRIWWTDAGVHQNLTFAVHPDPLSGQHCWHQAVRVRPAEPGDRYGDVVADTAKAEQIYRAWLAKTRSAVAHSPDGTRRPAWLMRPLKPGKTAFQLPDRAESP
ncbi:MAG TPA: molybdopterin-dependent oxidoreductase [Gemmatimonadales bacterium]